MKNLVSLLACLLVLFGLVQSTHIAAADDAPAAGAAQVFEPAPAKPSDQAQPTLLSSLVSMLPMLAVCYLIFYFMVVKPQDSKAKAHQQLVESLKRGENVITTGGIAGKVAGVENGFVLLEVANNVKIKVEQSHVVKKMDAAA